jgi:large subunit ribosomal protein L30
MTNNCLLVIRIRGDLNTPIRIEDTLRMLRIDKTNYATIIDDRPSYKGMLNEAKDYITWGEPDIENIRLLLEKRGRIKGNKKLDIDALNELGYENFDDLAKELYHGEIFFKNLKNVKPYFRLHPPTGGFKNSIKKQFGNKGELGYRGKEIIYLAKRMA